MWNNSLNYSHKHTHTHLHTVRKLNSVSGPLGPNKHLQRHLKTEPHTHTNSMEKRTFLQEKVQVEQWNYSTGPVLGLGGGFIVTWVPRSLRESVFSSLTTVSKQLKTCTDCSSVAWFCLVPSKLWTQAQALFKVLTLHCMLQHRSSSKRFWDWYERRGVVESFVWF